MAFELHPLTDMGWTGIPRPWSRGALRGGEFTVMPLVPFLLIFIILCEVCLSLSQTDFLVAFCGLSLISACDLIFMPTKFLMFLSMKVLWTTCKAFRRVGFKASLILKETMLYMFTFPAEALPPLPPVPPNIVPLQAEPENVPEPVKKKVVRVPTNLDEFDVGGAGLRGNDREFDVGGRGFASVMMGLWECW
ncbi:hypothetical protein Acr_11g0008220 [Actinidia rufa]|uniref:Uncharacterized protein n=1 Tax=Actinidia rufa TaxID=165716 RepID=A0A7J0FDL4_9ERIC|nr:hypothetical protein Acr_11g0008220 [Actinidia rufa]